MVNYLTLLTFLFCVGCTTSKQSTLVRPSRVSAPVVNSSIFDSNIEKLESLHKSTTQRTFKINEMIDAL